MRIASGTTDQYVYFVAVDSTDFTTRETGLTTFTVYRSKDGAAAAAMTTPTINETDSTNMPGVYELLLDEDMTIGSSNLSESMTFHITQASMAPVTIQIELFDPNSYTIGTVSTATAVTTVNGLAADVITAASIATDAIADDAIATGAIASTAFAAGAINAAAIAANTIDASAIATDAVTEIAAGIATHQIVDLASVDGTLPTVQQALYEIIQQMQESQATGTTISVKKQDGSTELLTFTIDNATNPTTITRAS